MTHAILTCIYIAGLAANEPAPAAGFDPAAAQQLQLTIRLADGKPLLPRLPVLLEITLTNPTGDTLIVPAPTPSTRDNPNTTLDVLVARDNADLRRIDQVLPDFGPYKENASAPDPEALRLAPGAQVTTHVPVSYDWDIDRPRPITDPGTLTFQARLHTPTRILGDWSVDRDAGLQSNQLTVTIPEPTGHERAVYQALMRLPRPWLFAAPTVLDHAHAHEAFDFAQRVVLKHPDTTYALYARAALAHMHAAGSHDAMHPEHHREAAPRTAEHFANQVLADPRYAPADDLRALKTRIAQQRKMQKQSP